METATTLLWLRRDGLLQAQARPGAGQSLADAQEIVGHLTALGGGRRCPLLVDLHAAGKPVEAAARAYYAGPALAVPVSAAAVVVGTPVSRVIGAFYVRLVRPAVPIRVFTNTAEAVAWLEGFRQ